MGPLLQKGGLYAVKIHVISVQSNTCYTPYDYHVNRM